MVPVAFGSQLMGSVIRPASYCGNWGYKPTYGALNRGGGHSSLSQSHLGMHAGSLADAWAVAFETSRPAGGDPGYPGIYGAGAMLPPAQRPRVLARLDGPGWGSPTVRRRRRWRPMSTACGRPESRCCRGPTIRAWPRSRRRCCPAPRTR